MDNLEQMTPMQWIVSGDTGISSKTIWAVMTGVVVGVGHRSDNSLKTPFDVPHDPADFGKCYRLLRAIPGWRDRISEMGVFFPKWMPMVGRWGELERLYEEELSSGKAPKLYELMCELEDEGRLLDGWVKTGPGSWKRDEKEHMSAWGAE